ncbi:hypothetical protein [Acinetobacter pittii]|uniref:hypothetical protein n=1 Tax=Acinetobacter pittii TaxID=48296 RepID=UPI003EB7D129
MGYQLETTALISIDNYNAFRIRRIMLILGNCKMPLLGVLFKTTEIDPNDIKWKIWKELG